MTYLNGTIKLAKEPKEVDFIINSEPWTEKDLNDFREVMKKLKDKNKFKKGVQKIKQAKTKHPSKVA